MYRIFHSFRLLEPPLDWNPNRKVVPGTVYFTTLLINYSWCKLWRCSWNCGIINGNILLYMIYRLLNKKKLWEFAQHYFYDINPIFDLQKYVALSTKCKIRSTDKTAPQRTQERKWWWASWWHSYYWISTMLW